MIKMFKKSNMCEKTLKQFEDWIIKTFPDQCEYHPMSCFVESAGFLSELLVSKDLTGLTLPDVDADAFNLEPADEIRLNRRLNKGIYRAKISIKDVEYLMALPNELRQPIFDKFINNIFDYKLFDKQIIHGSFITIFGDQKTVVLQLEDPRYVELRFYFTY